MGSTVRTYQFALRVISFIDGLPKDISTSIISAQLLRAATSIGANIRETQASPARKDFANFFTHALKSAHETRYWLELLRDSDKSDKETVCSLITEAFEITKIIASSVLTLKGKRNF